MAKAKGQNFIIPYQLYAFDVMVSVAESDQQLFVTLVRKLPEKDHSEINLMRFTEETQGRCSMFSCGATCIRIRKSPKTDEEYGTLAHEIFHAVAFLFERIGVKHTLESTEVYAYTIGYLTKEIYKRLK